MDDTLSVKLSSVIASAVYRMQPDMSGNVLSRLSTIQKMAIQNATSAVLDIIQESNKAKDSSLPAFSSGSETTKTTETTLEQHYVECDDCGVESTKTDHNGTAQQLWEKRSTIKNSTKNHTDQDVVSNVKDFIYWVANNDFEDPECIFVCAEWNNLCHSVNIMQKNAGEDYRKRQDG